MERVMPKSLTTRLVSLAVVAASATPAAAGSEEMARGAYLVRIMSCADCHMPRDETGMPIFEAGLSGGTIGFEIPGLGIFWPPNLTPDPSGLGGWTADEIKTALRTGTRPDGRILAPAMPWQAYAGLSDDDLDALVACLGSMPRVPAERHEPVGDADSATAPFYRVMLPH
jgi:mono/diheme cytochrome c family protein